MPIKDRNDAVEVESAIARIFGAAPSERAREIRRLFVEALDFVPTTGQVGLTASGNPALPGTAERIAELDGFHVLYVPLQPSNTDRVRKGDADRAARLIGDQIGEDLLLVFTNPSASQFHVILPDFTGTRIALRRMVVERDLPRRTAVQQVSNIYWEYRDKGSIRTALSEAFSIEPVTKSFFEEYKRIHDETLERVQGFGSVDEEKEHKKLFVQTLFNRLMFVYFLSRKGWLSFPGPDGRNDHDYLNALWKDYRSKDGRDKNFHVDRLKPLFFAGLNNPQSRDLSSHNPVLHSLIGSPPFLNGGLFEENELDKRDGVLVPDDAVEQVLRRLFDRFNFTVMESTPFDIEVAVDPEMLGKVFEELVTGRHDRGSYYTPRPVVSFMCREALKGYLEDRETGAITEAIARFVDRQDPSGLDLASARRVSEALAEVKVVDPACGSGAYLLGMMQELIELQTALFNVGVNPKALYDLKLEIIRRNLYGVDIDEFATNIAMLRLWLSLAIDYEGAKPEPLPNLDFKIIRGDSLMGPDPRLLDQSRYMIGVSELPALKAQYMRATADKTELKRRITDAEEKLRADLGVAAVAEGVVDWSIEFAEVFGEHGGFDVAIANPPYIQLQKDGGKLGDLYKDAGFATFTRTGDIYQLFYERGCHLLKPGHGLLGYITSNSWLRAEYGRPLRRYFAEKHTPLRLLDLGKDIFDSAIVDSSVFLLREGKSPSVLRAVDMDRLPESDFPPPEEMWGEARPDGDAPWSILSPVEQSVMGKMWTRGTPLKDWNVNINYGIKTGYNKAFIIDSATRDALIAEDPNSAEIIRPVLRGRDIQRYEAKWAGLWLIDTHNGYGDVLPVDIDNYPAVRGYLNWHYARLEKRQDKGRTPYNLRNCAYHEEFTREKLFWMDLTTDSRFALSSPEMYCLDTGFLMTGPYLKYLCATLNSAAINWLMQNTALTSGMGVTRWKRFAVERIPVPEISAELQRPFVQLVDRILDRKAVDPEADTSDLEEEIDWLVYDLYGLTDEETAAVADYFSRGSLTEEEEDEALLRAMREVDTEDRVSREEVMEILLAPNES